MRSELTEYKGEWFIPQRFEKKISGTLKISYDERPSLELICSVDDFDSFLPYKIFDTRIWLKLDIILGICLSKEITLTNCEGYIKSFSDKLIIIIFYPDIIFIGHLFNKLNEIKFDQIYFHLSYLDDWINKCNFNIKVNPKKRSFNLSYNKSKPILLFVDENVRILIDFKASLPLFPYRKMKFQENSFLKIKFKKAINLEYYLQIIKILKTFLILAMLKPIHSLAIEGISKKLNKAIMIYTHREIMQKELKRLQDYQMLFTFSDISNDIGNYINNLFNQYPRLEAVLDIYSSTIYNYNMFIDHEFLSLMTSAEAFHRRIFNGKFQENNEFRKGVYLKLIEAIPDDINNDYKKSIKSKMRYLNEFTFKTRLEELLNSLPIFIVNEIIGKGITINNFIDGSIKLRNLLVHQDNKAISVKPDIKEMYFMAKKIKAIMHLLLLKEIGFNLEKVLWQIFTR